MPTDYHQLEQKIKELQAEFDQLKAKEKKSKLPKNFNRQAVLDFLDNPYYYSLDSAFSWDDTPQGVDYWNDIHWDSGEVEDYKIPNKAKIQLLKWAVESYREQYGA